MHFLFQVASVCQKQCLKKVMKIVLKALMNRAGLPTDSLICTLATYTGFGWSAQSRSTERMLTAAMLAGWGLTGRGYFPQYHVSGKTWHIWGVPQECVCLGVHIALAKTYWKYIRFLPVFYWVYFFWLKKNHLVLRKQNWEDKSSPRGNNANDCWGRTVNGIHFILAVNVFISTDWAIPKTLREGPPSSTCLSDHPKEKFVSPTDLLIFSPPPQRPADFLSPPPKHWIHSSPHTCKTQKCLKALSVY